jgi:hypothetical protein
MGRRIARGLYKTKDRVLNADVNGSYNILRKYDNNLFTLEDMKSVKVNPKLIHLKGFIYKSKEDKEKKKLKLEERKSKPLTYKQRYRKKMNRLKRKRNCLQQ